MLEGIRIVSFCHYLQGPAASQYLADMGADVIKIESIGGAFERNWSGANTYIDGVSGFFLCANRNKRIVAVDLKSPEGREAVLKIIDTADAIVENFRPGVLDRLGLGYEAIKARKPDIVFASATGFGGSGPLSAKPGQDLLAQARSGLVYATAQGSPVGAAIVDQHGATLLALGVLAGLTRKLMTGRGARVESNLLNAGVDLHAESLVNYFSGRHGPDRFQRDPHLATWFHEAPYGVYQLADARIVLSSNDPTKLARAIGSDELGALATVDRYAERDLYVATVAKSLAERTLASVAEPFDAQGIWWAPVSSFDELRDDPQLKHNDVFRTVPIHDSEVTLVNHPIRYDGETPPLRYLDTEIGEHTREVLTEVGYSAAEIEAMAAKSAIRGPGLGGAAAAKPVSV